MIAGLSYSDTMKLAGNALATREGCRSVLLWYLLSHLGFSCRVLRRGNCDAWPVLDGAFNIVQVYTPAPHWVLERNGKVYDPANQNTTILKDYHIGNEIIAVHKP